MGYKMKKGVAFFLFLIFYFLFFIGFCFTSMPSPGPPGSQRRGRNPSPPRSPAPRRIPSPPRSPAPRRIPLPVHLVPVLVLCRFDSGSHRRAHRAFIDPVAVHPPQQEPGNLCSRCSSAPTPVEVTRVRVTTPPVHLVVDFPPVSTGVVTDNWIVYPLTVVPRLRDREVRK